MQSIINKSEFTNFLREGAVLQLPADEFKLIWGPFTSIDSKNLDFLDQKTIIFKPQFWDFRSEVSAPPSHFTGEKEVTISRQAFLQLLHQQDVQTQTIHWAPVDEKDFIAQYRWSSEKFASGVLQKTVPITFQQGAIKYTLSHLVTALTTLLSEDHYGSTFGFWSNHQGFLGQSPEIIVAWDSVSTKVETAAVAGTYRKQPNSENLILKDPKVLQEHRIVVEDLKSVLQNLCPEKQLQIESVEVLNLKFLNHLLTKIAIHDVKINLVQAYVDAIHPTAALGLFPRHPKLYDEFKKFENQKVRDNFAAPFGFMTVEQINIIAAIRSFSFASDSIRIFSGCGVTAESSLTSELSELADKRNSVKKMMGLDL